MDELVPLMSRAQTTSIQRLNRSLWSDTSASSNGEATLHISPDLPVVIPGMHQAQSVCQTPA